MAAPEIVLGSSLLALFVGAGFAGQLGFWTILIAHIMFCLSFVVVTVRSRLAGMDDNLEQAAMDLYATPRQTFWRVTFPLVFPGILGAALLSFSLSFDDFIVTNLNAGQTTTFPMYVWGVAQRGVPMQVNVVGTRDVRGLDHHRGRRRAELEAAGASAGLSHCQCGALGPQDLVHRLALGQFVDQLVQVANLLHQRILDVFDPHPAHRRP